MNSTVARNAAERKIRNHSQPREERGNPCIEPRIDPPIEPHRPQLFPKHFVLEINRDIGQSLGHRQFALGQQAALPGLRGRVVDLKDAKLRIRIAVREGVQPCAEQHVLRDVMGDSNGKAILGIAAARHQKSSQPNRGRAIGSKGAALRSSAQLLSILPAKQRHGDRILEHQRRRIVDLVRGAPQGYAESSSRRNSRSHRFPTPSLSLRVSAPVSLSETNAPSPRQTPPSPSGPLPGTRRYFIAGCIVIQVSACARYGLMSLRETMASRNPCSSRNSDR